jgi:hypothetical protein
MPSNRASAPWLAGVVLIVVIVCGSAAVGAPYPHGPGAGGSIRADESPCSGAVLPHNYSGALEINRAPATDPVALSYTYDAVVTTNLTDGVVLSSVCSSENGTVTPAVGGGFALSIDASSNVTCDLRGGGEAGQCVTTTGPFEVVNVAPAAPSPPGYVHSVVENGTNFTVDVYSDLSNVTLAPGGPVATFSPGATDGFEATPITGAGTESPATPSYSWTLAGVGWTFVGETSGASVNVTSAPDAAIGNLSVVASLAVAGGTLVTPARDVELVATPTSISTASLNRTVVDVGQPIDLAVAATGAADYAYTATAYPGLGDPEIPVPCAASPGPAGATAVACDTTFDFEAVGVAQPVVAVTNGVSSSTWSFPDVTVDPAPWVVFDPGTPVGYANASVPIVISAGSGTGTAPFERACLEADTPEVQCQSSPGPTWTFGATYADPGQYPVTAWIVDATGANRSASTSVSVVAPLSVALAGPPVAATAGTPVTVAAVVAGGALPARIWWNGTDAPSSLTSFWIAADGAVHTTVDPSSVGLLTVTLAVVDALGTMATVADTITVGPGAATSVAPEARPASGTIPAGTPTAVDWQALDAAGIPVRSFSSPAEIEFAMSDSGASAPGWVNASGVGPLSSPVPGWFSVPASAWASGALNVSVAVRSAGPVDVELTLASTVSTVDALVPLVVTPDVDQLRLFDPLTTLDGARANDTLWQVTDAYGNPAVGATVITTTSLGGSTEEAFAPVEAEPDGATQVWVNWSAPAGGAGTVVVRDLAGAELLPPVQIAGSGAPWVGLALDVLLPIAIGAAAVASMLLLVRPRRRPSLRAVNPADDAASLQRLAEGRSTVIEVVRRNGPIDLAQLARIWEPPPAPPDLADWVASLLTDGTLDARFDDDGIARFCLSRSAPPGVRVTVNVAEFDRGEARREAERVEWDDPEN